jgi:phosphohistidine swiveling domain-containing protein
MSTVADTTGQQQRVGVQDVAELSFDAPGPGAWMRDRVHMPRPWSRYQQEIHPPALAEGFRAAGRRYGWLVDHLDFRFVHDFAYFCVRPVEDAEVPERIAAAERALESRVWREDAERWEREVKPAAIRAHLALQAVDPSTLSRDLLLAHLERCREHQRQMIVQHHTFNGAAFGPVGDFIAHVTEWTGIDPTRIVALARGAAPESAGASAELDRLVATIASDRQARALLDADDEPGEILTRLRELDGEAGAAAAEYLDSVGYRLLDSLDVGDPYALEVPEVIVRRLRRAVEQGSGPDEGPSDNEVAQIRDRVPATHRDEFDALLSETRLTSRVRDERGIFSEVWAGGLVRRAILAAGELLAREGRIDAGTHLVEADYPEMRELIQGSGGPSAEELARRAQSRVERRLFETPSTLGDPPQPPPPLDALPPAVARAMRALDTSIGALFGEAEIESEPATVRGIAASPGTYTGTARVIYGPEEFARLQPGDVLVTVSTTESFNTVLPLLGALVTDSGGLLSHAAIVSREYGIPGVVGTRDATTLIHDGALVRVVGDSGEVEVMG